MIITDYQYFIFKYALINNSTNVWITIITRFIINIITFFINCELTVYKTLKLSLTMM